MIEMATVLLSCVILIAVAFEYTAIIKRDWGENAKSFF